MGKQYPRDGVSGQGGVSYCAPARHAVRNSTWDSVCIVGLMNEAVEEANFMKGIGSTVFYVTKDHPKQLDEAFRLSSATWSLLKAMNLA